MDLAEQSAVKPQQLLHKNTVIDKITAYYELTKPGIVGLSLVAALTGIYFGNHGVLPQWDLIIWTFITLGLAVGGSCMLNNVYDRDIDANMPRTSKRALASGHASPTLALTLGIVFIVTSLLTMTLLVNTLASLVTAAGVIGYVGVYTMWLKRRSPWANTFGGLAGAVPPMVGFAAVTGQIGIEAWTLFFIMLIWQHPHALSLALKYRGEYASVNVPVVPVARGVKTTKWRIFLYALVLTPLTALPYYVGMAGQYFLAVAMALNAIFIYMSYRFMRSEKDCDMRIFAYSIIYLILLFSSMVIDSV